MDNKILFVKFRSIGPMAFCTCYVGLQWKAGKNIVSLRHERRKAQTNALFLFIVLYTPALGRKMINKVDITGQVDQQQ